MRVERAVGCTEHGGGVGGGGDRERGGDRHRAGVRGDRGCPADQGRDRLCAAGSGTGLYMSLNCEYSSAAAGTAVPILAGVDGGGFTVTGQGSTCPNSGTVNTAEGQGVSQFNNLSSSALASWASPACSVQETLNSWPAQFTGLGYDAAATPADFTASDGAAGQPYVLLGAPVSAATQALAPSAGGEVPAGATTGGTQWGIAMIAGDVYTIAGSATGVAGKSGDGGAAGLALLAAPQGVAVDAAGNLYIADTGNNRIQEIAKASGTISTVAGSASGSSGSSGDGGAGT